MEKKDENYNGKKWKKLFSKQIHNFVLTRHITSSNSENKPKPFEWFRQCLILIFDSCEKSFELHRYKMKYCEEYYMY